MVSLSPLNTDEILPYSIPLRSRFRGITSRDGLLIRKGNVWAEFSPFWDYGADESATWLRCAVDVLANGFPPARRSAIPVNVTVPAIDGEHAQQIVRDSGGCTTAKVKVAEPGQPLDAALERVAAVRDALGPGGKVRVDANGAWDVDTATRSIPLLDKASGGLEYVEQPCQTVAELAAVRRNVNVPIAADESIRRSDDPDAVARAHAADIVVLKVQPLGGVRAALTIAERLGLPVVVSSALETSVGISAGIALAAALPELPYACGLATVNLLTGDVVESSLVPVDGDIPVRHVSVSSALAARHAASAQLSQRWVERLAAACEKKGSA